MTMKSARELLGLDKHSLNDLLDTLVEAGPDGNLTRAQFTNAMVLLVRLGGNVEHQAKALALIDRVFDEFDAGSRDQVDLSQLTSGLSILCDAPMVDKLDFAFSLFDFDGDGLVSFGELVEYMSSIFAVLFVTSPGARREQAPFFPISLIDTLAPCCSLLIFEFFVSIWPAELRSMVADDLSAVELAEATAYQAFTEAGLSEAAKIHKATFSAFVNRGLGGA